MWGDFLAEIKVKVGSVTAAQKGKRALLQHGYRATIRRAAQLRRGDGCGYSLVFKGEGEKGIEILRNAGIHIISVSADDLSW